MEDKLRTKEAQNWLKCMIATYTTRDALSNLASDVFVPYKYRKTCTKCNDRKQGCNLCSERCRLIWDNHRFKAGHLKGLSWSNTDLTKWCTNSWELAKCYTPSTGYKEKPTADITDFNGIINALYNCTWMKKYFTDDLSQDNNICTKIINTVLYRAFVSLNDIEIL
ncbi:hypothetical protein DPMN_041617 [Dreissena polymorpha]|uniref:Uncharacterized protein n=1 Tax=Dreissena polymorpha TaxID=45954 RepID=A0A9D4CZN3_DREPO|nr:hypothetical protein DPMN_041617 [Dreissena polymorpha]